MAGQEATALASRALPSSGQSMARYFGSHYINPNSAPSCSRGEALGFTFRCSPAGPVAAGTEAPGAQGRAEGPPLNPYVATCSQRHRTCLHRSATRFSPPHVPSPALSQGTASTPTHVWGPEPFLKFLGLTWHLLTPRGPPSLPPTPGQGPGTCILNQPYDEAGLLYKLKFLKFNDTPLAQASPGLLAAPSPTKPPNQHPVRPHAGAGSER